VTVSPADIVPLGRPATEPPVRFQYQVVSGSPLGEVAEAVSVTSSPYRTDCALAARVTTGCRQAGESSLRNSSGGSSGEVTVSRSQTCVPPSSNKPWTT